jgi:hypothetical protein
MRESGKRRPDRRARNAKEFYGCLFGEALARLKFATDHQLAQAANRPEMLSGSCGYHRDVSLINRQMRRSCVQ